MRMRDDVSDEEYVQRYEKNIRTTEMVYGRRIGTEKHIAEHREHHILNKYDDEDGYPDLWLTWKPVDGDGAFILRYLAKLGAYADMGKIPRRWTNEKTDQRRADLHIETPPDREETKAPYSPEEGYVRK